MKNEKYSRRELLKKTGIGLAGAVGLDYFLKKEIIHDAQPIERKYKPKSKDVMNSKVIYHGEIGTEKIIILDTEVNPVFYSFFRGCAFKRESIEDLKSELEFLLNSPEIKIPLEEEEILAKKKLYQEAISAWEDYQKKALEGKTK